MITVLRECPEVNTEARNPAKDRSLCPPPLPSLPSLALELGRDKTSSAFNVIILLPGNVVAHWPGVAHFFRKPAAQNGKLETVIRNDPSWGLSNGERAPVFQLISCLMNRLPEVSLTKFILESITLFQLGQRSCGHTSVIGSTVLLPPKRLQGTEISYVKLYDRLRQR